MPQNSFSNRSFPPSSQTGFKCLSTGTLLTLASLAFLMPASHAQANSPQEAEAQQFLLFVNRTQQQEYLKSGRFAKSFEQLGKTKLNIIKRPAGNIVQTANYTYKLELAGNREAHIFAYPSNSAQVRSYSGAVFATPNSRDTQQRVCQSVRLGDPPIRISGAPNSLFCPAATMQIK